MTQTVPEWNLQIADELHRMADDFAKAETAELPKPRMVSLNIQPGGPHNGADDEVIDTVNALGLALLGEAGEVEPMSNGVHFYRIEGRRGPVEFNVYREISDARAEQVKAGAVLAAKDKELARLRAEVAQLRGLAYTRADDEADDPTPVSPARVPLHTGAVTDEGLVDETETGSRIDLGADGCGCPITEEIRPNGSSIQGTERVEHRERCWAKTHA